MPSSPVVSGSADSCVEEPGFRVTRTRFGVGPGEPIGERATVDGEPIGERATVDLGGDDRSSGPASACSNGYVQATSNERA